MILLSQLFIYLFIFVMIIDFWNLFLNIFLFFFLLKMDIFMELVSWKFTKTFNTHLFHLAYVVA